MIRRILIWIRNFIDKILWKTAKHQYYSFNGNTATNCTFGITFDSGLSTCKIENNTFSGNTGNGINLYDSADNPYWEYLKDEES